MTDKKKNQRKKFLWFFCLLRGRIEKEVIGTKKEKFLQISGEENISPAYRKKSAKTSFYLKASML